MIWVLGRFVQWECRADRLKQDLLTAVPQILQNSSYLKSCMPDETSLFQPLKWIRFEEIPHALIWVIILAEDQRFYDHCGIDFFRLVKVAGQAASPGNPRIGGSTLTQQVVKNLWGSPKRNIPAKIHEMAGALILDKRLGKEKILELYVNVVLWVPDAPGIVHAAETVFQKKVCDLTIGEMVFLIAALPNPSVHQKRTPGEKPDRRYYQRIKRIKERVVQSGLIKKEDVFCDK